jgi:D-alanine transaminase/branched-chain amino acid aminotransferase
MRRNDLRDSGVRITITGGRSDDGYSIAAPTLIISQKPLVWDPAAGGEGIRLITYPHRRQLPAVKSIDYLMPIWLQPMLRERGADDVLYEQDGRVSECPRSNVFIVTQDEKLVTPARDVLMGITRKHLLLLAAGLCATQERDVTLAEFRQAGEVFITSTTKGALPVREIDGRQIGDGRPGPLTRKLRQAYSKLIASEAGLTPPAS